MNITIALLAVASVVSLTTSLFILFVKNPDGQWVARKQTIVLRMIATLVLACFYLSMVNALQCLVYPVQEVLSYSVQLPFLALALFTGFIFSRV